MLQQMRQGVASWFAKGLLFLLVISFGFWGIAGYINGAVERNVATVGDVKISGDAYDREFRQDLQRIQQSMGVALNMDQARQFGLGEATLNRMIETALVDQMGQKLGLRVPDAAVRDDITNNPVFRNSLGQFDRLRFQSMLMGQGYSEQTFVALMRREMLREQLLGSLTAGVTNPPAPLINSLYIYRQERRFADYFTVSGKALGAVREPTEDELTAYHKDHAAKFTAPELRALTWVTLSPADLVAKMNVAEDDIKDEYDARQASNVSPEKRNVQQAVYSTEAAAKAALDLVKGGLSFTDAVQKTQQKAPTPFGSVAKNQLPAAIATSVFELPVNQVGGPLQSPFGWHLVQVTAITPGTTKTLAEMHDELKQQVALRMAADALQKVRTQFEDKLAGGNTLEEAAQSLNFAVRKAEAVDAQGQDGEGKAVASLPAGPRFLSTAFLSAEKADPDLQEGADGTFFAVRVDRISPAALRPYDSVKPAVKTAWQAEQHDKQAQEKAQALVEQLKGGADIQALAQSVGSKVQLSPALVRGTNIPALSPVLQSNLFQARPGAAVSAPAADGDGYVVARLSRIEAPDPAAAVAQRGQVETSLIGGISDDLLAEYRSQLEKRFGVSIDRAALASASATP